MTDDTYSEEFNHWFEATDFGELRDLLVCSWNYDTIKRIAYMAWNTNNNDTLVGHKEHQIIKLEMLLREALEDAKAAIDNWTFAGEIIGPIEIKNLAESVAKLQAALGG